MNAGTNIFIAVAILAAGLGLFGLGAWDAEEDVRHVDEVLADPDAHRKGTFTLLGVPRAAWLEGLDAASENGSAAEDRTERTTLWRDGTVHTSTHTMYVKPDPDGTGSFWEFTNTTRRPGDAAWGPVVTTTSWHVDAVSTAVRIAGFEGTDGLWGLRIGPLAEPMQPKPSQFTGRLAASMPDGVPLPDGALVFEIDSYKAGCSSKFLPDGTEGSA